jgi:FdhD protein
MSDSVRERLPEEHVLRIRVGGTHVATLLCTRERLAELATGWLFAQGLSIRPDTTIAVTGGERDSSADVSMDAMSAAQLPWRSYLAAGLDAGTLISRVSATVAKEACMPRAVFEQRVREAFDMFREARGAGGYHHAALVDRDAIRSIVLDLSRHNAVDKVVGDSIRQELDTQHAAIVLSGRISADIALKAARLGVPIVASRSLPTAQAVELAEASGLMLVCRVLDHRRVIFGRDNLR